LLDARAAIGEPAKVSKTVKGRWKSDAVVVISRLGLF